MSTRDLIARHARELFDQRGYAATSVRAVAAAAGFDPALVIRHFGSKEELFLSVMGLADQPVLELHGPLETLGTRLVGVLLAPEQAGLRRTFMTLIRASEYDRVRASLQETTGRLFADRLAALLPGPDARLRAHLIGAQLLGVIQAWTLMVPGHVAEADRERAVALYGRAVQRLIDAPVD